MWRRLGRDGTVEFSNADIIAMSGATREKGWVEVLSERASTCFNTLDSRQKAARRSMPTRSHLQDGAHIVHSHAALDSLKDDFTSLADLHSLSSFEESKLYRPVPPQCGFCGKSFSGLANLTKHERVHTNERPFQCSVTGCGI